MSDGTFTDLLALRSAMAAVTKPASFNLQGSFRDAALADRFLANSKNTSLVTLDLSLATFSVPVNMNGLHDVMITGLDVAGPPGVTLTNQMSNVTNVALRETRLSWSRIKGQKIQNLTIQKLRAQNGSLAFGSTTTEGNGVEWLLLEDVVLSAPHADGIDLFQPNHITLRRVNILGLDHVSGGAHSDAVQIQTAFSKPADDILIEDCLFTGYAQGLFFANDLTNLTIQRNRFNLGLKNAIAVKNITKGRIADNEMFSLPWPEGSPQYVRYGVWTDVDWSNNRRNDAVVEMP